MKKPIPFAITVFILGLCFSYAGCSQKFAVVLKKNDIETKIDDLVKKYTEMDIFSGVVLVAQKGEPIYHKAYGLANREKSISNNLDTRFDIGSVNKAFTKVVVLQMVSEGKLKLSDNVGKFLPGFSKEVAENVTVEHLLNHTSGLGDYHNPNYWDLPKESKNTANIVEMAKQLQLEFQPGTDQMYSNTGYVVLSAIVENASGESFYDLVEDRIVKPLGLKNTFLREKYTVPNRAIGYLKTMRGELEDNDYLQEQPKADGGFYSTTIDILTFYRAYHYGNKLWDESIRKLDESNDFYLENMTTGGAMTHAGGFNGSNTVHFEILRDQISVVVFANMDEPVAEKLGVGILSIIRGKQPEAPSLPAMQLVYKAYKEQGIEYVKNNFETLSANFHADDPKEILLNNMGYNMLYSGETEDAINIFKLNTEIFPDLANGWDSYGEALLKSGDEKAALIAYKKALAIRPDLPSAAEAIKKLESK